MRKTESRGLPGQYLLKPFLTDKEYSFINYQLGPINCKLSFEMRVAFDFPNYKDLVPVQHFKMPSRKLTLDDQKNIREKNKNIYGFLSKHTYHRLSTHNASLMYLVKTSRERKTLLAVLGKDIDSSIKNSVLEEFDKNRVIIGQLKQNACSVYQQSIRNFFNPVDVTFVDEKEEKQINETVERYLQQIKFDKLTAEEYERSIPQKINSPETKGEVIIKPKKADSAPWPSSGWKHMPLGFIEDVRKRIMNEKDLQTQVYQYSQQLNPDTALEVKNFYEILKKFLPVLWKKMHLRMETKLNDSPLKDEAIKRGLDKNFFQVVESEVFNKFFRIHADSINELSIFPFDVKNIVDLLSDKFVRDMHPYLDKAKVKVFKEFTQEDSQHLTTMKTIFTAQTLFQRWKFLLRVWDLYGNIVFWAHRKGFAPIASDLYIRMYKSLSLDEAFQSAILFNQDKDELERIFNHLNITKPEYEAYLLLAVLSGNTTAVIYLNSSLKININDSLNGSKEWINSSIGGHKTPLELACWNADLDMIRCLHWDCGADLMYINEKHTALHYAIESQQFRAVQYLLENIQKDTSGKKENFIKFLGEQQILSFAVKMGNRPIISLLERTFVAIDPEGNWPEVISKLENQRPPQVKEQLNDHGYSFRENIDMKFEGDLDSVVKAFKSAVVNQDISDIERILQPLDHEIMSALFGIVFQQDSDKKDDQNLLDRKKMGILHLLLFNGKADLGSCLTLRFYETVKYILLKSKEPLHIKDSRGNTPLLWVVKKMFLCDEFEEDECFPKIKVVLKLFIINGTNHEIGNDFKETPLNIVEKQLQVRELSFQNKSAGRTRLQGLETQIGNLKEILEILKSKPEDIQLTPEEEKNAFGFVQKAEGLDYLDSLETYIQECVTLQAQSQENSFEGMFGINDVVSTSQLLAASMSTAFKQPTTPAQESKVVPPTPTQTTKPEETRASTSASTSESTNPFQPQAEQAGPRR